MNVAPGVPPLLVRRLRELLHAVEQAGYVHGATDEHGIWAVERPVHVHDFHATILHLMGLDHTKLTYRHAGRDYRLTDVHGEMVQEVLS